MTSEIKVDTISEQTSANGVTIDGLTIKDGNIQGSPALVGTTPSFTIGDGGAEDTKIVFDGNALDYYIGLDDSADNLIIGSGSTVGSNSLITIDSDGDFTLDSAADITLDVGGGDISLKGSGAEYGKFNLSGNSLNIHSSISDGDIVFKGSDGGSAITALTLDMSSSGQATFNSSVFVGNHFYLGDSKKAIFGAGEDLNIKSDGTNGQINAVNGTLILDVAGDITLDAGGGDIILSDDTTIVGTLSVNSSDLKIRSRVSDKDLIFQGNDGGSEITALTLDMSDAGTATFNHDIVLADDNIAKFGDSGELVIYHHNNGSSYIQETGGGDLQLLASNFKVMNAAGTENKIAATTDGAVDLYYNNIKKFLTSSTGINLPVDGDSIKFGADSDVILTHVHNTGLVINSGAGSNTLQLQSTDAGGSSGPILNLYRNSSSPADDDILGQLKHTGRNSNSEDVIYSSIITTTKTVTNGSENGLVDINVMSAGSLLEFAAFQGSVGTVFNESSNDLDFRVESNGNSHMLFVDGGNNSIGINNSTPGSYDGGADDLVVGDHSVSSQGITIASDDNSILYFADGTSGDEAYRGSIIYNHPAENFIIRTGGFTTRMTIDSTGATVVGQVLANGGGVSVPTFAFTTDPNTGMTRPTTDTLQFVTGGAEAMRITSGQTISTGGEASPDVGAGGLGLDQNALDNNIFTLKSSDVGHPFTNIDEADTYFAIQKFDTNGGTEIKSFRAGNSALEFNAYCSTESDTKSTQATAAMRFNMALTNGSTGANPISSNDNLCTWHNDGSAKMILDAEGDLHADGALNATAYDTYEDAHLVRALDLSHGQNLKGLVNSKFDEYINYNHETLAKAGLVGRENDGTPNHFINVTGMQRLHNGAIWQQYEKHQQLAEAVYEMAKEALGKDKADAILNKHDIKLLN
jgi:hypothetical protein